MEFLRISDFPLEGFEIINPIKDTPKLPRRINVKLTNPRLPDAKIEFSASLDWHDSLGLSDSPETWVASVAWTDE